MRIFYIEVDDFSMLQNDEQILEPIECQNGREYYEIEVKQKVKARINTTFEKLKMDLE